MANRLEALTLARAIQDCFGGEVFLDWPELDALRVPFAKRARPSWLDRLRGRRVRECNEAQFADLRQESSILVRCLYGPRSRILPIYLPALREIRLRRDLKAMIEQLFQSIGSRPVVGVHLRRGDFGTASEVYDTASGHTALPLDWVEAAMRRCLELWPNCAFFVSATGSEQDYARLTKNFDMVQVPVKNPYVPQSEGHQASCHPVADLFALSCCEVIVATPLSSFSHLACNVLGPPATALIPPQRMRPGDTTLCTLDMPGDLLGDWVRAFREPRTFAPLDRGILRRRPFPRAVTDWIAVFEE